MFRALLFTSCLCALTAVAGTKKPAPKPTPKPVAAEPTVDPAKQEALKAVLASIQKDVSHCVKDNEAKREGEWKQTVRVKVTLDRNGAVMEQKIQLEPKSKDAPDTKSCVEALVQGLQWPTQNSSLNVVEREWTFIYK